MFTVNIKQQHSNNSNNNNNLRLVTVLSFCHFTLIFFWRPFGMKTLKFQFSMQTNVLSSYCFERMTLLIIRYKLSKDLESNKVSSHNLKLFTYIVFRVPYLKAGENFFSLCFITGNWTGGRTESCKILNVIPSHCISMSFWFLCDWLIYSSKDLFFRSPLFWIITWWTLLRLTLSDWRFVGDDSLLLNLLFFKVCLTYLCCGSNLTGRPTQGSCLQDSAGSSNNSTWADSKINISFSSRWS